MFELKVPQIGESITSAFIGTWLKQPGDAVAEGEAVVEIDSDKASLELPAPVNGVLRAHLAEEGEEVLIGAVIARIEQGAVAAPTVDVVAEGVAEGVAQPAAESSSSTATAPTPERSPTPSDKGPQSGPAARQVAAGAGVDIASVAGSGVRGRVLAADVQAFAAGSSATAALAAAAPAAGSFVASSSVAGSSVAGSAATARAAAADHTFDHSLLEERVPLSPLRRTIARRLVAAQHSAAMLTTFNEVDLTSIIALRKRYQDRFVKRYGVKLGFMSFFVKATIEALKAFPEANAELDEHDPERLAVIYKRYYNIGVAVSTDRGLMVPVLRGADQLSFAETELAIADLAGRGRDGKLRLDDFKGGTFTISNGGVFGSLMSTPILNPPQVGILGMHTIQQRPVGVDGQIQLRPMMYLAMSYDHRIIDGRGAVSFLVRIKELVEAPERILIEV